MPHKDPVSQTLVGDMIWKRGQSKPSLKQLCSLVFWWLPHRRFLGDCLVHPLIAFPVLWLCGRWTGKNRTKDRFECSCLLVGATGYSLTNSDLLVKITPQKLSLKSLELQPAVPGEYKHATEQWFWSAYPLAMLQGREGRKETKWDKKQANLKQPPTKKSNEHTTDKSYLLAIRIIL